MAAQQTFAFFQAVDAVGKTTRAVKTKSTPAPENTPAPKPTPAPKVTPKPTPVAANDTAPTNTASILKKLRSQVGCVSTIPLDNRETCSTGCQAIDDLLPSGGLCIDVLTEWVASSTSSGTSVMALIAAAHQLRHPSVAGPLVVVDTDRQFYPPAAIALGIPADQIILVRPTGQADIVWSIDQALRCESVGAVWANVGSWLDDRDARRFQLAAEMGKTAGLLVRPAAVRGRPSFADVRFHVDQVSQASLGSSLTARITVDRCRGGTTGQQVLIQVDDQARMMPIVPVPIVPVPITARSTSPNIASHSIASHHDTARTTQTAAVHLANQLAHPAATQPADSGKSQPNKQRERRA